MLKDAVSKMPVIGLGFNVRTLGNWITFVFEISLDSDSDSKPAGLGF